MSKPRPKNSISNSQVVNCPVWVNFTDGSQSAQNGFKNTHKTLKKTFDAIFTKWALKHAQRACNDMLKRSKWLSIDRGFWGDFCEKF